MEAKELMIGDWVNVIHNGKPLNVRVTLLDETNIGYDVKDEVIVKASRAYKPIPLTAEILEKNRFNKLTGLHNKREKLFELSHLAYHIKVSFDYDIETRAIGDCYYMRVLTSCYDLDMNTIFEHRCIAVHELQHALRLCGLNELADNFKID